MYRNMKFETCRICENEFVQMLAAVPKIGISTQINHIHIREAKGKDPLDSGIGTGPRSDRKHIHICRTSITFDLIV